MKHSTAQGMMEALAWMEIPMGKFDKHLSEIEDESERKEIAKAFGELMGRHFTDMMIPIIRQYPEFDPDKSGEHWYKSVKENYAKGYKAQ
jgi:hypothetical protein